MRCNARSLPRCSGAASTRMTSWARWSTRPWRPRSQPGAGKLWTRAAEVTAVSLRIIAAYRLFMRDYDPASGAVPDWLPGEFHGHWIDTLAQGRRPLFGRNKAGFFLRLLGHEKGRRSRSRRKPNRPATRPASDAATRPAPGRQRTEAQGAGMRARKSSRSFPSRAVTRTRCRRAAGCTASITSARS